MCACEVKMTFLVTLRAASILNLPVVCVRAVARAFLQVNKVAPVLLALHMNACLRLARACLRLSVEAAGKRGRDRVEGGKGQATIRYR